MEYRTDLHEAVDGRLRSARQRYTAGRQDLVHLLDDTTRPLTIPEILDRAEDLSQSSVYRNLQILEQVGVVRRVITPSEGGARYELAEELTAHHHHLICRMCGSVQDFRVPADIEHAFDKLVGDVDDEYRFRPEHHRVDLIGTCAECR